jgi:hypothetical protein
LRGEEVRGWDGTEALERHRLLVRMTFFLETRNRRYTDLILLVATRWLKRLDEGGDPVIREARERLRAEFPTVHQAAPSGRGAPPCP